MEFFTVNEVAEKLKVHPATIKRWLREGKMRGLQLGDRAGWRVSKADYDQFIEEQQKLSQEGKAAA
jgi:excisionase family DNA binding protein